MFEFFKGWRRKAGCVTLGLACAFAAGWVRSVAIYDELVICFVPNKDYAFVSGHGRMGSMSCRKPGHPDPRGTRFTARGQSDLFYDELVDSLQEEYWSVSYESIVAPLSLLSLYLLLSKSRPAKPPKSP